MKSLLYESRKLKAIAKSYQYVIIYGAKNRAKFCKAFCESCHIPIYCYVITGGRYLSGSDDDYIEGIPVYYVEDFPFAKDMSIENTLFLIAVSEQYELEIAELLNRKHANYQIYFHAVKPSLINLTTIAGCKVNCSYCPQETFLKNYFSARKNQPVEKELNLSRYKKMLRHIPKEVQIHFAGFAEPFLNQACCDMISYTAAEGYHIQINTTLVGANEDKIKNLFFCADWIPHLPDEKNGCNIVIDDNYIRNLKCLFEMNRIQKRVIRISAPMGINSKLLPYIPDDIRVETWCMDRAGNIEVEGVKGWDYSGSITCTLCNNRLDKNVLLPNGDTLLCCQDWSLKYKLGNLLEETYIDIIDGIEAEKMRKKMKDGQDELICHHCNFAMELED